MRRSSLTYKDYHTPTSADILVNAFRRWLDKAADVSRDAGDAQAARAATGYDSMERSVYKDDRPRAELLDRYASHTVNCNICKTALKSLEEKRERLSLVSTALVGATGASGTIIACTSVFLMLSRVLFRQQPDLRNVALKVAMSTLSSSILTMIAFWKGVKKVANQRAELEKEIQRFYFEDYVHADKL